MDGTERSKDYNDGYWQGYCEGFRLTQLDPLMDGDIRTLLIAMLFSGLAGMLIGLTAANLL